MSEPASVPFSEDPEHEEPVEIDKFNAPVRITAAEAKKAARDAGMVGITIKSIVGAAKLGQFLSQKGVIRLGRTYLLDNLNAAREAREAVVADLDTCSKQEDRNQLHSIRANIIDASTRAAVALVKSDVDQANAIATNAATVAMCEPGEKSNPVISINLPQANPPPENKSAI